MSNKLNLFIVGAAKCGTTFLNNLLITHPDINGINTELHFFDNDNITNYNKVNSLYDFNNNYKYFLDSSPSYSVIKPVAERIYKYNKNSKIIFCIRNHVERILSHINMMRRMGGSFTFDKRTLDKIIDDELKIIFKEVIKSDDRYFRYIKRTLYYEQLERFMKLFGEDNVYIFNLDNYNLDNLYKFLDIKNNNYNIEKLFKRIGVKKNNSEIEFLKNHKHLHSVLQKDRLLLKQNYNIII